MAIRYCKCGCGGEIAANASLQMTHLPGHRQRKYQRKRDARVREALRAVGGRGDVKTTPTRAASRRRDRSREAVRTRYALVHVKGSTLEILGFATAKSKRAVERAFGIVDRDDLAAVAGRHLPEPT
jgi:hypothetical protein